MESPRIELSNHSNDGDQLRYELDDHAPDHGHEFSLPQADGGKQAWLFLGACFIVEALVWGKFFISKPLKTRTL